MIHIAYKLKESDVHGIGLFAGQDIASGDLVYSPNLLLDTNLTEEAFKTLSPSEQKEVAYYGYWNAHASRWHVAFEAIRFLNHGDSAQANVTQDQNMILRAKKNIATGEELLQDYAEIYRPDDLHFARMHK